VNKGALIVGDNLVIGAKLLNRFGHRK